jgi:hypothetical protein
MSDKNKLPARIPTARAEIIADSNNAHPKLHRTLASFSALLVNTYIIIAQKIAPPSVEFSLLFWLLFFVTMVIAAREKDASYCFTPMVIATTPFIIWGTGIGTAAIVSIIAAAVTIGFQRGVTMSSLASGASDIAESLGQSNTRRKILKLSGSEIDPELLLNDDLEEFSEVEAELLKVKKNFDKSSKPMQNALKQTLAKVEQLQKHHARVLARSAGL